MKLDSEQKDEHLKRIQEEINEVARREKEFREKMQLQQDQKKKLLHSQSAPDSGTIPSTPISTTPTPPNSLPTTTNPNDNENINGNKENIDETRSDDSGFSTSSSPVNGAPAAVANEKKYIRSTCYKIIPSPPPQRLLVRTMSTPQIFQQTRRFNFNPSQKGIMQRFIASRGKLINAQQNINNINNNKDMINGMGGLTSFIPPVAMTPPIIERDTDGRPIRKGFVPVEEKIQKELKDIKNREIELKRLRKLSSRQSQPDLLDSIEDENSESDDESDVEHCFGPRKLRTSKSISELCDALNSNSISPRTTPSPNFDSKIHQSRHHHQGGMRPAVSLAQLCDLDPEEAPSSHELIAKWENFIQQNA